MKKIILIALFSIVTINIALAQWKTGNDLIEYWKEYKQDKATYATGLLMGYVQGCLDSKGLVNYLASISNGAWYLPYEIPSGTQLKQICQILGKYLESHPEQWTEDGYWLLYLALKDTWPKKQ